MKFETWFVEQHGNRPSTRPIQELTYEMSSAKEAYEKKKLLWYMCKEYDARKQSALYAWCVKDKDKKGATK